MKKQKFIIYLSLIIAFTIALTVLPIQVLYSDPHIELDSDYYDSHGYVCGTNQHWAKYVLPECANFVTSTNGCINEGPFTFHNQMSWLPPHFDSGSMLMGIEIKTVSGDYKKYNFNSNSGSDIIGIGDCTWSVDWYQVPEFNLEINTRPGPCCWHVDWIKVWYTGPIFACPPGEPEPEPWVRGDRHMVCSLVEVNENNCFELVFIYEYADNNHVMIYDEQGNLVYETDMQYGNARIEVCLPDGMYKVMTYHDQPEPLQEFYIGKPVPEAEM
jgi:hypothetical protein